MLQTFTDSFAASLLRWPGSKLYDLLGPGDAGRVRLFLCLRIFESLTNFDDLWSLYVDICWYFSYGLPAASWAEGMCHTSHTGEGTSMEHCWMQMGRHESIKHKTSLRSGRQWQAQQHSLRLKSAMMRHKLVLNAYIQSITILHSPSFSFILLHSPSFSFILLHSPSFSFILLHSPSFSFILLHSPSFSFILLHSPSFSFILVRSDRGARFTGGARNCDCQQHSIIQSLKTSVSVILRHKPP